MADSEATPAEAPPAEAPAAEEAPAPAEAPPEVEPAAEAAPTAAEEAPAAADATASDAAPAEAAPADAPPADVPAEAATPAEAAPAEAAGEAVTVATSGTAVATEGSSATVVLAAGSVSVEGGSATVTITTGGSSATAHADGEPAAEAGAEAVPPADGAAGAEGAEGAAPAPPAEDAPAPASPPREMTVEESIAAATASADEPITTMYDKAALMRVRGDSELPGGALTLLHSFGYESAKRSNVSYVDADVLVFVTGNTVTFFNTATNEQSYLPQIDGRGVGALAVHPSRKYFAVGEKGTNPNVYVYEYPSLNLVKMLRNGTERGYSTLRFNKDGTQLASVGSFPDFWLTVWNWKAEGILLRSKAFSQEVFHVSFSEYFDGQLMTSGTGHIRFWKMASTFTGLKLQGDIGKFGNVELSDIAGYCEMPDGKVLSGTERGALLVWDGGLIKVVIHRPGGLPCHDGMIECIFIDMAAKRILTAGADGCVRFWDFNAVDTAEPGDDTIDCDLKPLDEIFLKSPSGTPMRIKSLIREEGHWVVQDEAGALWSLALPTYDPTQLLEFHAGPIVGLATTRNAHFAITAGHDGSVRLFDYRAKKQVLARSFSTAASCMGLVPTDASGRSVAVGFANGVLRVLVLASSGWLLAHACKPHKDALTCLAFTPDGGMLATASRDKSVFFFDVQDGKYEPVGFIMLPAAVTALAWSPDSQRLLAGCEDGKIFEYERPDPHAIDASKTYLIELESRSYTFKKPRIEPKRRKKAEKTGRRPPARGRTTAGDSMRKPTAGEDALKDGEGEAGAAPGAEGAEGEPSGEGEEGKKKEEEDDTEADKDDEEAMAKEAALDTGVYPVKTLAYVTEAHGGTGSSFYLTAGLRAFGAVYECSFDTPDRVVRTVPLHPGAAVTALGFSADGRFVLSGGEDGTVRLATVDAEADHPIKGVKPWMGYVHDCMLGAVASVALSFDDAYLLSAAADGSFFVHAVNLDSVVGQDGANIFEVESAADSVDFYPAADITEAQAYSIEEAKQKAEEDALIAEAERQKMGVREHLELIRRDFSALIARNEALSDKERLPREEFDVDPDLRAMIEEDAQERMRVARLELQWDFEKARCALEKIRGRFLDNVAVERIVLRSFKGLTAARGWGEGVGHQLKVTSFRMAAMSAELELEIAAVHEAVEREASARLNGGDVSTQSMRTSTKISGGKLGTPGGTGELGASGVLPEGADESKLSKQELRRLQRKKRDEAWAVFNATKPNDKYEKPEDIEAIKRAQQNMGDFKLKSDPDYVVPEDQRVNAEKKRRQMVLLEEAVHKVKVEFNNKFLALREVKRKICRDLESNARKIEDINTKLGIAEAHWAVAIQLDEEPERREMVSDEDLREFKKKLKKMEAEAKKGKSGGGLGGFGGGGGGADEPDSPKADAPAASEFVSRRASLIRGAAVVTPAESRVPKSHFEEEREKAERIQLTYQKDILIKRRETAISAFDEAILELRREKFRLEADLKAADIKRLVMYKELLLLKEFEKRDVTLKVKLDAKMAENSDMLAKIDECEEKLDLKKEEVDRLNDKRKKMVSEAEGLIGDNSSYRDALLKIFLRKIKRMKKASADDADEEEDEEDDEEEEEDDDEEEQEVCPPGCDQALYERVCEMRERRLDQEDVIAEIQKSIEALKKEKDAMGKKKKTIESALLVIEKEIQAFQKEKQAELNRIDITVALKMHQIEYLVDGRLPEDLSAGLVFSTAAQQRLRDRIGELIQEKAALRRQQKELRREHVNLNREKKTKESKVVELEARAFDVQMLKFGQVIDLELLDKMGAAKGTEELKAQLAVQEAQHASALRELERQIEAAARQLSASTKDNTACLLAVSELMQTQRNLESALGRTDMTLGSGVERHKREVSEQGRLVELVNLQASEIERLRREVAVLRHKGGQVFAA